MSEPLKELREACIHEFWHTIPFAWHNVKAHIHKVTTEKYDITVSQFHVLRHIRQGFHFPSELAEAGKITRPAVSRQVDLMVERGLITRRRDENDRRIVHLELTELGDQLLSDIFDNTSEWMDEKLQNLDEKDLEIIAEGFSKFIRVFKEEVD